MGVLSRSEGEVSSSVLFKYINIRIKVTVFLRTHLEDAYKHTQTHTHTPGHTHTVALRATPDVWRETTYDTPEVFRLTCVRSLADRTARLSLSLASLSAQHEACVVHASEASWYPPARAPEEQVQDERLVPPATQAHVLVARHVPERERRERERVQTIRSSRMRPENIELEFREVTLPLQMPLPRDTHAWTNA